MMFNDLEFIEALRYRAEQVRARLRDADIGSSMTIKIVITGEVQRGDLSLVFEVDALRNPGLPVEANDLDAAAEEVVRRVGFKKRHQTILLSAPTPAAPASHGGNGMNGPVDNQPF